MSSVMVMVLIMVIMVAVVVMAEMMPMVGAEAVDKGGEYGEDGGVDEDTLHKGTFCNKTTHSYTACKAIDLTLSTLLAPLLSTPLLLYPPATVGSKCQGRSQEIFHFSGTPPPVSLHPTLSTPRLKCPKEIPAPGDRDVGMTNHLFRAQYG